MKVLIVDDNSENLYLLESILKGSGYITVSANNGVEALALARKDIPDLIITDILMPVMDGFTLCREFKKDEKLCNVPFIFYTATYSDPRDEEFALRLGADRFILKPQDPEEFISIVKELLKEEKKKNIIKTEVSSIPEIVILKEYNQTLVRKLENKMLKLEQSEKEIKKNNILLHKEIEERKQAEEKLRESEEKYRSFFENSMDAIFLTTPDGKTLSANPEACRMFEYTEEELIALGKKGVADITDPNLDILLAERALNGKVKGELTMIRKDGTRFPVEISSAIFKNQEGQELTNMIIRDITERKQAQEALRESELKWRYLVSNSPDYIALHDIEGKYLFLNHFAEGFTEEKVIGSSLFDYLSNESVDIYKKKFDECINSQTIQKFEYRAYGNNKTIRVYEQFLVPILNKNKELTLLAIARDITDHKLVEENLRESHRLIEGIINSIPVRVFWKDKNLVYLGCNTIFAADAGFSNPQEIIGKDDYQMGWRDQAELYRNDDRNVIESGRYKLLIEEPQTTPEGKTITLLTSKIPLRDSKGEITGLLGTYIDITERKLAEEKLQESEEMFRIASENLTDVVFDWDLKEKVDWFGDIDNITGYPPGEFPRTLKAWVAIVHPEDMDRVMAALEDHLKGAATYLIEYRVRRRDGEWRWWSARGTALRNDRGEPYKMVGSITDITERKLSADALRASEAKFRSYVNDSPQGIFVVNLKGQYIEANEAALNQIGCSKEYLLQKTIVDILPKEELEKGLNHFNKLVKEGHSTSEIKLLKTSGEQIDVILDTVKISDDQFLGFSTDITKRIQAEEALSNERSLLRTIIDLIPDAIYAVDIEGRKILANTKEIELSGKNSEDEIIGKTDFDLYPEIEAQRYWEQDQIIIQSGKPTLDMEDTLISKDGQIRWMLGSKVPLRDVHGQITGIVGVNHDITERKRSEEVLQQERDFSRTIIQTSPTFFVGIGNDGKTIMMNDSMLQTLGYTLSEVVGMDYLTNFVPVEDREKLSKIFEALVTTNKSTLNENSILTKDGRRIIVEWHGKNILKPNGELNYYFGIGIDITERKLAEEKIREKDIQFRKLSSQVPDLIFQFTRRPDGTYFVPIASEGIKNIFGCSPEDVLEDFTPIGRVIYAEDSDRVISDIEYSAKHLSMFTCEFRVQIPGKSIQWIYSRSIPEKLSDGSITWYGFNTDVTEHKKSEEALQESEERYRSVTQSAYDAIITTDSKGTIINWNKGAQEIFGYLETEISGKKLDTIIPKDNLAEHFKNRERSEQSGEQSVVGKTVELQGLHKNGKGFPIELSLAEWEIPSGKFFTGIIRDITERKGKEKEVVILANALRSVDECVSITDMEDKIIFINQSFLKTYGYREDEIIGKDMSVFRSQKNPPALVKEILSSTLSGGWNGELWNKRKDGSEFPISLSTRLIEDKEDKFFGLIGVASDITERKLVEKTLNESEKKFRSVWEKSAEGMRITNQAGNVVMANDAYCKLMEKPLDDIEGKLMSVVHEETRQVEILFKHEEQFKTRDIPSYLEKEITLWNGNKIFVEVLSTFLEIENQPTLSLSIFKDISDRKRTESELIAAKEKAEEMNRLKSNFLANMSHELRTPLVGILGFADILRQDVVSEETKAMADTIYKSGKRLSETLNLILDLSKFESEKLDIKHRKIDLVSKAEEIINSFEGAASKKGLTLKSSFSQSSIIINFDERAFHSILNNLINNALKFTSEGSVTTTIILNVDHVELKVIDTGIGIAELDYQNIFEEFRQASEGYNRNFEGSGLGLSITKKLVEKFGGTISVESEIEKGTTFTVILPVTDVETKEKELTENVSKIIPELSKQKAVKPIALLVDDDPFVFAVLKRYAIEYIDLETTVDADFAIKKLKKKKYDLIFMDINLRRGMDGKEATKIIRTIKGYESIPIIATTGYAMVGDKEEFLAAGCSHYLSKPFSKLDIDELLEKVFKLV